MIEPNLGPCGTASPVLHRTRRQFALIAVQELIPQVDQAAVADDRKAFAVSRDSELDLRPVMRNLEGEREVRADVQIEARVLAVLDFDRPIAFPCEDPVDSVLGFLDPIMGRAIAPDGNLSRSASFPDDAEVALLLGGEVDGTGLERDRQSSVFLAVLAPAVSVDPGRRLYLVGT